jgi:membrane protein DedA with SNARE-associated domain
VQDLVDLVPRYGLAIVFANVLMSQVGLPVPVAPTLVLAGALAANGALPVVAVFATTLLAAFIGDGLWFAAGRIYGRRVLRLLCRISLSPDLCVRKSERLFERRGKVALVISKFFPGLSLATPPLAGAMHMGWPSFALLNGLGLALWAVIPIGAGMLFHDQVGRAVAWLEGYGKAAGALVGLALLGYVAFKWWQRGRR